MIIGVPKESKDNEARVGLTPHSAQSLTAAGHTVIVEKDAGDGIGAINKHYRNAGATIASNAKEVFSKSKLIVKIKEPLPHECKMLKPSSTLFTFLHLAANKKLASDLLESGATCIAYETVTDQQGHLPLLTPMSRIAGRLSTQIGSQCMLNINGGMGKLMSGQSGVEPANTLVLGAGVVGFNAAQIALGMGSRVVVLDNSLAALDRVNQYLPGASAVFSNTETITREIRHADLIIGAVLVPGAKAPTLVPRNILRLMRKGSVIVDVAIDQGGCFATSQPTTHNNPTYTVNGVLHYCVPNMPGSVAYSATHALNFATLPYIARLAGGIKKSLTEDKNLLAGLSIHGGKMTCNATAKSLRMSYCDPLDALN